MLDLSHPTLQLRVLPSEAWIARFPPHTQLPPALFADPQHAGSFLTVSKTRYELSVIWDAPSVTKLLPFHGPATSSQAEGSVGLDGPWRIIRVAGPFEFSAVGVMSRLSGDLAARSISLMAISTCE
jgi:hypothetical protein